MQNAIKKGSKCIFYIVCSILVGILFLGIGQLIPRSLVIDNVKKSYETLKEEGSYPIISAGMFYDNWTDAYFLNTCITEYEGNWFQNIIANAYTTNEENVNNPIESINVAISEDANSFQVVHSRYWAGYVTLLKILLIFLSLEEIRTVIMAVTVLLLCITIINIYTVIGYRGVIPFILSILASGYITNAMCLVYSWDIILMLIAMNVCVYLHKNNKGNEYFYIMFTIVGIVYAYMNYWAFPLITLGFPLVLWSVLRYENKTDEWQLIKDNFIASICWTLAMVGTVVVKMILSVIALGNQTGSEHLQKWMGFDYKITTRVRLTIERFLGGFLDEITSVRVIIALIFCVLIYLGIRYKNKLIHIREKSKALYVIMLYPCVWYAIFFEHCGHGFTWYMFGVLYYAFFSIICTKIGIDKKCTME